jgi:post-segregation antitoxin (ccd killing protein)
MNEIIKQRGMKRDVRMRTEKKWKKGGKEGTSNKAQKVHKV